MSGVNKVILIGHLGQDPELRSTAGGQPVANFSMATNESYTDKAGQKVDKTEWHKIVVWGKTAEICHKYLKKGKQIYIEGKLQTRQWENKEGQKQYTTEINAQHVQFLGGAPGAAPSAGASASAPAAAGFTAPSFTEDDIPF